MVMTQSALLFIGVLATLSSIGIFINFDQATRTVVTFLSAILWGIFGMSSFDVIVTEHVDPPVSEPIMPLVVIGIGLAMMVSVFGLYQLVMLLNDEVGGRDAASVIGRK